MSKLYETLLQKLAIYICYYLVLRIKKGYISNFKALEKSKYPLVKRKNAKE